MKHSIITLLLFLLSIPAFSQKSKYEYSGRHTTAVKKEKINDATFISDIAPDIWLNLQLPYKEREELNRRRKTDCPQGYYIYPKAYNYIKTIDYVSVEISATIKGIELTSKNTNDKLTTEQKNILNAIDPGNDVSIKIKFKYKNLTKDSLSNMIIEGELPVTVVPEVEAEYPGGFQQFSSYLIETFFDKISDKSTWNKALKIIVKYTVNEQGQIVNSKIVRTSKDPQIDQLLIDAINKMPKWKPAENSKGIKERQEFRIPLGGEEGC